MELNETNKLVLKPKVKRGPGDRVGQARRYYEKNKVRLKDYKRRWQSRRRALLMNARPAVVV